jgi:hypothetical protein
MKNVIIDLIIVDLSKSTFFIKIKKNNYSKLLLNDGKRFYAEEIIFYITSYPTDANYVYTCPSMRTVCPLLPVLVGWS